VVHFLVSHPTPPVFDGPEDRNGRRNHDEIRLWSDYVKGQADYLYDDRGVKGGLSSGAAFIVAGDLNADPHDGDSLDKAIMQLLENPMVQSGFVPESTGGGYWAEQQGGMNTQHAGNPLHDTGDFSDENVGNMRIDYVLPSQDLRVVASGVLWPKPGEPGAESVTASDHRMVWVDIEK
jgi:endonuclease/exonuclease/phosphatase family metal-dependent hydrolase